jgi:hypothetical protein
MENWSNDRWQSLPAAVLSMKHEHIVQTFELRISNLKNPNMKYGEVLHLLSL